MNYAKSLPISIFLIILSAGPIYSQPKYNDVIFLKNGKIIHGNIIEQSPDGSIKIQTKKNDIFRYDDDEIARIKDKAPSIISRRPQANKYANNCILRIGFMNGNENYLTTGIIANIRTYAFIGANVGGGWDFSGDGSMIPIFFELRLHQNEAKIAPIIYFDIGYSFSLMKIDDVAIDGGMMAGLGGGISFKLRQAKSIVVEAGIKNQNTKIIYNPSSGRQVFNKDHQFFVFTMGSEF